EGVRGRGRAAGLIGGRVLGAPAGGIGHPGRAAETGSDADIGLRHADGGTADVDVVGTDDFARADGDVAGRGDAGVTGTDHALRGEQEDVARGHPWWREIADAAARDLRRKD